MDVFRFAKIPMRANDPTRRYRMVRGEEDVTVGRLEIGGDVPDGDSIVLTVDCRAVLADAEREIALNISRRFLDELVAGWGHQVAEVPGVYEWVPQADGVHRMRIEYQVVCANP